MGLEKLKSVFKEGFEEKSSTTNLADMVSEFGTPIDELFNLNANTLIDTGGWTSLYNPDHTAKEDVGYHYPNVSRDNLNIKYHKVASAMLTDREFLEKLNDTGKPVIVSVGMATEEEIDAALDILNNVEYVLSCTSTYPTKEKEVNFIFLKGKYW